MDDTAGSEPRHRTRRQTAVLDVIAEEVFFVSGPSRDAVQPIKLMTTSLACCTSGRYTALHPSCIIHSRYILLVSRDYLPVVRMNRNIIPNLIVVCRRLQIEVCRHVFDASCRHCPGRVVWIMKSQGNPVAVHHSMSSLPHVRSSA